MAATADELTINYEEDGKLVVKELDKEILTKGSWVTVMYRYQEMDRQKGGYKEPKFSIRRYQKQSGEYRQKSKFNISSIAQGLKVAEILQKWCAQGDSASAE